MRNVDFSKGKTRIFSEIMQIMVLLTFAGGYFSLFSHQNARSDLSFSSSGCNEWESAEEIISAEFLVSLRTSAHVPGFAVIKRTLWLC